MIAHAERLVQWIALKSPSQNINTLTNANVRHHISAFGSCRLRDVIPVLGFRVVEEEELPGDHVWDRAMDFGF
jgi:hypothetical protein